MDLIKDDAFRKQLKQGVSGAFIFFGDEDYMKMHTVNAVREAVCPDPSFALFNEMKIDVIDYSASALLDALMPLPMMAEKKLITVNGLNIDGMRPDEVDSLCDVLSALDEYYYNIVIISVPAGQFDIGSYPKRTSAAYKKLSECATPVRFDTVSGARLVSWVGKHFSAHGVNASDDVCSYLIDYAGRSMYTLSNETEKLSFYVLQNGRDTVTKEDVRNVSISEISITAFALANAIVDGRSEDALNAIAVMKFRRVEPVMLLSEVSGAICDVVLVKALLDEGLPAMEIAARLKLAEFKVKLCIQGARGKSMEKLKNAVKLCAEADASVKMSPQGYTAIEKLVCSL
jgi:DNA polymerase-3 subunit delta